MTTEARNKAVLERLYAGVWNGRDPAVADELVAPDYYIHDRDLAAELRGPALYKALANETRKSFSDMKFDIEDLLASGEKVALRWTMVGTHDGPLVGIEPTGQEVTLSAIEINRFEDGQLAETWSENDMLGLLNQLDATVSQ